MCSILVIILKFRTQKKGQKSNKYSCRSYVPYHTYEMYADDFLVGQQSDQLQRGPGPMVHAMAVQLGLVTVTVTVTVIALI